MAITSTREHLESKPRIVPLTVETYHRMIDTGILASGEPYELIEGMLVLKDRSQTGADEMTVGTKHIWVVEKLIRLSMKFETHGCFVRTQQPVVLPPASEPEPDGAIVRGSFKDYRERKPVAEDVLVVIEAADSSLAVDREVKQRIYANAGIGQYLIVNLMDDILEQYTEPQQGEGRYAQMTTFVRGQSVKLMLDAGQHVSLLADELLP